MHDEMLGRLEQVEGKYRNLRMKFAVFNYRHSPDNRLRRFKRILNILEFEGD